jgi:hypothetical protein
MSDNATYRINPSNLPAGSGENRVTGTGALVQEIGLPGLTYYAGYMAGTADHRLRTGTKWTMYVYENLNRITPDFLFELERRINRVLGERGCRSVQLADVIRAGPASAEPPEPARRR